MDGFHHVEHDPILMQLQFHERHEQQLPNSLILYISVHAFQLLTTLCSLAYTVDVYQHICHT